MTRTHLCLNNFEDYVGIWKWPLKLLNSLSMFLSFKFSLIMSYHMTMVLNSPAYLISAKFGFLSVMTSWDNILWVTKKFCTLIVHITTQARFKCVPTFCGSIIHILIVVSHWIFVIHGPITFRTCGWLLHERKHFDVRCDIFALF